MIEQFQGDPINQQHGKNTHRKLKKPECDQVLSCNFKKETDKISIKRVKSV